MSDQEKSAADRAAPNASLAEQTLNGTHSVIKGIKEEIKDVANSASHSSDDTEDSEQPLSHFHSLFHDVFTWKYPKATGFFFLTSLSLVIAFRYVNVLRYVFKVTYMLFAGVAALEIMGKPLGAKGVVSSLRPKRYYTIPRESLDRLFDQLHDLFNFFILEFQRVVFVENIFATLAAFVTCFLSYFLVKYIPLWTLMLIAIVTAFTAPLIYLNNKEIIDHQITNASHFINEQLSTGKKLTEKYAGDAAAAAKATAADLQQKVQGYTGVMKATTNGKDSTCNVHDIINNAPNAPTHINREFPEVPTKEPSGEPVPA